MGSTRTIHIPVELAARLDRFVAASHARADKLGVPPPQRDELVATVLGKGLEWATAEWYGEQAEDRLDISALSLLGHATVREGAA